MVTSTITIHCGQAGNQVAAEYWNQILLEHQIDKQGYYKGSLDYELERIAVNFSEVEAKRYVPRAVNVDMEPGTIDATRSSSLGNLFKPDSYISGLSGAGNNFAKGFYTEGVRHYISQCSAYLMPLPGGPYR